MREEREVKGVREERAMRDGARVRERRRDRRN